MSRKLKFTFIAALLIFFTIHGFCSEKNKEESNKPVYAVVGGSAQGNLTPFTNDSMTQKIMRRNDLQDEGRHFAKQGLYDEALEKYSQATNPSLLNHEYDKSTALWAIRNIHQRQGKLDLARQEHEWFLKANSTKEEYLDKKRELDALIKARDAGSNQPVYDYIKHLRTKYKKYIPPQSKGDSGFHSIPINDIIHLYNWMGDADGAIIFMSEVLSSKSIYPPERKEYERVKAAFEEDKRTGQRGHLQKVIETSDYIGW